MAMNRKLFWLITAILLVLLNRAEAQQQTAKLARIGFLSSAGAAPSEAFRQALRNLGYVGGKNVAFEFRASGGTSPLSNQPSSS